MVVKGGGGVHHHSRNSGWRLGVGVFLIEARSRKRQKYKNGSMDSKTAWYDKFC
jgi:hypothetical protein